MLGLISPPVPKVSLYLLDVIPLLDDPCPWDHPCQEAILIPAIYVTNQLDGTYSQNLDQGKDQETKIRKASPAGKFLPESSRCLMQHSALIAPDYIKQEETEQGRQQLQM